MNRLTCSPGRGRTGPGSALVQLPAVLFLKGTLFLDSIPFSATK